MRDITFLLPKDWEIFGKEGAILWNLFGKTSDVGGFGKVHVTDRIRRVNDKMVGLMNLAVGKGLCLMNTCFEERKTWLTTLRLDDVEIVID